jgi:hypothetical protein
MSRSWGGYCRVLISSERPSPLHINCPDDGRELTYRPFHRSRGRAGQARRDGGTSVSARASLRYVVRVQDAAFGGGSEDISFLLRPCLFSTCIPTPAMVLVQLLYLVGAAPRAPAGSAVRDSAAPTQMRPDRVQRCALGEVEPTDCPPGPMPALGGSGHAAPKQEARFDPIETLARASVPCFAFRTTAALRSPRLPRGGS